MRRGDIFSLRLPKGQGHEQRGKRFGVVVQSDAFLPRSVVLVAPTSASVKPASFRPEIEIEGIVGRRCWWSKWEPSTPTVSEVSQGISPQRSSGALILRCSPCSD